MELSPSVEQGILSDKMTQCCESACITEDGEEGQK